MPKTYTFGNVIAAIEDYMERVVVASMADGLAPTIGIEASDRFQVGTGANRHVFTASVEKPVFRTVSRDTQYPPNTKADFRRGTRGLQFGDDVFISQAQPYSATRERQDNALRDGIEASRSSWGKEARRAARKIKPR